MHPIVGVGVIVKKGNLILLGQRKNPDGSTCWSFPGGKVEAYEELHECAMRELKEETNIEVSGEIKIISLSNVINQAIKMHSITIGFLIESFNGILNNNEPDKFVTWEWFALDKLPKDLFLPTQFVLEGFLVLQNKSQNHPCQIIVI